MDGGAWWAAVRDVATSRTRLSDFTFTFHFHALEEEMATHSRIVAWRMPGTEEPGGLPSMGLHRVGHDWSNLAAAAESPWYLHLLHLVLHSHHPILSLLLKIQFSSVQFSRSVMSNSLWPYRLQHARPPCPSSTPRVYSNSCPFSQWCHPTISSSVIPFSSCLQFFPASGSFQMGKLSASGSQSIGVSASASGLPMNIQDWFPLG